MQAERTIIPLMAAGAMALGGLAPPAYAGEPITSGVVSTNASTLSPVVPGGQCYPTADQTACRRVLALEQVGNWIYASGIIDSVVDRSSGNGVTLSGFHNIFRFDATTKAVDTRFKPQLYKSAQSGVGTLAYKDSQVTGLATDGVGTIYAAGSFTIVADTAGGTGVLRKGVAALSAATGALVPGFKPQPGNGGGSTVVYDVDYVNGSVWIGGLFTHLGKLQTAQTALAFLDPTTGALTGSQVSFSGQQTTTVGTKVAQVAINNAQAKAAVIGNFTTVGGQDHREVVVLNIDSAGTGSVSGWDSPNLAKSNSSTCNASDTWARGVDWSPDNVHFDIGASGGGGFDAYGPQNAGDPNQGALCDALTRFDSTKTYAPPDFVNVTGFDSMFTVVDTGDFLYTGGHNKYLDYTVYVNDKKVSGVASKQTHYGIGAIDTRTGHAVTTFNPSSATGRGAGWASALSVSGSASTGGGVYIGGDAFNVNGDPDIRRLAYFPSTG